MGHLAEFEVKKYHSHHGVTADDLVKAEEEKKNHDKKFYQKGRGKASWENHLGYLQKLSRPVMGLSCRGKKKKVFTQNLAVLGTYFQNWMDTLVYVIYEGGHVIRGAL